MRRIIWVVGFLLASTWLAQAGTNSLHNYRRIVVVPFESSVQGATGLTEAVRESVVGGLKESGLFAEVLSGDDTKDKTGVLELRGRLVDFAPGNAAKRLVIGFGTGRAHARFEFTIADAATGEIVWQGSVKQTASFWFNGYTSSAGERAELPEGIAKKLVKELNKTE